MKRNGLLELLAERMASLPEVPKKVLAMHYYDGLRLGEIAAGFNLSTTQICQIHTEAVNELRKWVCTHDERLAGAVTEGYSLEGDGKGKYQILPNRPSICQGKTSIL